MICKTANIETLLTRPPLLVLHIHQLRLLFRRCTLPPRVSLSTKSSSSFTRAPLYLLNSLSHCLSYPSPRPTFRSISSLYPLSAFLSPAKRLQTRIQPRHCHSLALPISFHLCSVALSPSTFTPFPWLLPSLPPPYLSVSSTYILQATLNAGLARDNPRPLATASHAAVLAPPSADPPPTADPPPAPPRLPPSAFVYHRVGLPLPTSHATLSRGPLFSPTRQTSRIHKQLTNTQVA